ncbi:MAG: hypothetical protein K2Q22_18130 [Cytophagales bacterium]|nr:hypothetical protein [Cytophagales bacterium]
MVPISKKDKYRAFCEQEMNLPIFMQAWWLDAVCIAGEWDVCLVEKDGKVIAAWPYYFTKRFGFTLINVPPMAKFSGPWIKYPPGQKEHSKLAFEKQIIEELILQLPHFLRFRQYFHYGITNWLPLYWKGFVQTTYYSYVIEKSKEIGEIEQGFNENLRRKLTKAKRELTIEYSDDFNSFLNLLDKTANRNDIKKNYPRVVLFELENQCKIRGYRIILNVFDKEKNHHSSLYLVWDNDSVWYIMSGTSSEYLNSNSLALSIWEGIQFANKRQLNFDFEGSMIEGIEQFFRSFGAVQKPYFYIVKSNGIFIRLIDLLLKKD